MRKRLLVVFTVAASLLAAGQAFGHHGTAGYDMGKTITLNGTVTKFNWSNPHVVVYLDAKDESGNPQHWTIELSAPLLLERSGWSKNAMKPGDQIVVETHPSRNGAPVGISATATFLLKFEVNGKPLAHL